MIFVLLLLIDSHNDSLLFLSSHNRTADPYCTCNRGILLLLKLHLKTNDTEIELAA